MFVTIYNGNDANCNSVAHSTKTGSMLQAGWSNYLISPVLYLMLKFYHEVDWLLLCIYSSALANWGKMGNTMSSLAVQFFLTFNE